MTLVNITDTSDKKKTVVALTADEDFLISEAEKELNAAQQEEAFGEYTTGPKASKQKAAEMLAIDNAQTILDNSIFALRNNQSTVENEKRFFKDTETLADKEYLVDVALPILAADNAVADAELDNPDDVGSLTDEDALFTAEDRAKYDMEAEILNKAEHHLVEKGLKGMAWGIAQRFVPFVQSYKDWRVSSKDTAHALPTETRKKQRQKFQEAKRMMSATEYGKFLNREFNRLVEEGHDRIAIQEYFEDMFTYNSRFEDVMQALDFLSVGKLVKGGPKIGRTIKAGNKKKALEVIKEATTEEKIGHTIPTIAKPAEGPVQSLSAVVEDTEMLDVSNTKALEAIKDNDYEEIRQISYCVGDAIKVSNAYPNKHLQGIYENLKKQGIEALLDDRQERAGVKFKDADLIGIPVRIVVGKKCGENIVEYKLRTDAESSEKSVDDAISSAVNYIKENL